MSMAVSKVKEDDKLSLTKSQDIDVENNDEDNDEEPDEQYLNRFDPTKISISVTQPTIYNLVQRMRADPQGIDMTTNFQRHSTLWNKTNQSRLIESLLLRIPLPTFYFDGSNDDKWLIIDGLQRLTAFKAFIIDKTLKLTNLEYFGEFNGKYFDELPQNMIRRIEETQIVANIIQPGTPDEVKFDIFKRINTGGFNLNAQEIRHAVYHGQAADFIEELSESPAFKVFHISTKRMMDQELVTRFVAFYIFGEKRYKPRMIDFLENTMKMLQKLSEQELNRIKIAFEKAMQRAYKLFGYKAFKNSPLNTEEPIRTAVNKAMFDVWSVALGRLSDTDYDKLKKSSHFKNQYDMLFGNTQFTDSITSSTGHTDRVLYRFSMVKKLIEENL